MTLNKSWSWLHDHYNTDNNQPPPNWTTACMGTTSTYCTADRVQKPGTEQIVHRLVVISPWQPTTKLTAPSGYGIRHCHWPTNYTVCVYSTSSNFKRFVGYLQQLICLFVVNFCYLGLSTRVLFQSNMQTPPALSVQRQRALSSAATPWVNKHVLFLLEGWLGKTIMPTGILKLLY